MTNCKQHSRKGMLRYTSSCPHQFRASQEQKATWMRWYHLYLLASTHLVTRKDKQKGTWCYLVRIVVRPQSPSLLPGGPETSLAKAMVGAAPLQAVLRSSSHNRRRRCCAYGHKAQYGSNVRVVASYMQGIYEVSM